MQNPPKNDQEIATWLTLELSGTTLMGVKVLPGDPNSFVLEFVNQEGLRGGITVASRLKINLQGSHLSVSPGLHINLDTFTKP